MYSIASPTSISSPDLASKHLLFSSSFASATPSVSPISAGVAGETHVGDGEFMLSACCACCKHFTGYDLKKWGGFSRGMRSPPKEVVVVAFNSGITDVLEVPTSLFVKGLVVVQDSILV
ncbi:hypothetical protein Syun_010338 [Stephania yunnanensis]|uniref:Uncharacterized protein n=1 Tax=Stephania yunnanensis TaxID=152371 RepID=A0AAP0KI50_9MAGN